MRADLHYSFTLQIFRVGWLSRVWQLSRYKHSSSQTSFITPPAAALLEASHQSDDILLRLPNITAVSYGYCLCHPPAASQPNPLTHFFSFSQLPVAAIYFFVPLPVSDGSHRPGEQKLGSSMGWETKMKVTFRWVWDVEGLRWNDVC